MSVSNKELVINMLWRCAERIAAQVVSFVVSLILARILCPNDYGLVALVVVIVGILDVFATRGFNQALIQKRDVDNLDYSTVFWANIVISCLLYGGMYVIAPFMAAFYGNNELCILLRVLSIKIIVNSFNAVQQAYVQRNMQYKKFFYSTFIGTCVSAILGIISAINGMGAWALVIQSLSNTCIDTLVLFLTIEWKPKFLFSFKRLRGMSLFGFQMMLMGIIDSIYNQMRTLVVGKMYSTEQLAYYNKGQELPKILVDSIQISASNVMFSALSREESHDVVKNKMREYLRVMYYVLCPILMGIAVVSKPLITFLFTEKWIQAVPFLVIYCFFYLLWVPQIPLLQAINSRGRADISLKASITHRICGISLLLVMMGKGPIYIAFSAVLADCIIVIYLFAQVNKLFAYRLKEFIYDIANTTLITGIMVLLIKSIVLDFRSPLAELIVKVLIGVIAYVVLSVGTKNSCFMELLKILRSWKKNE